MGVGGWGWGLLEPGSPGFESSFVSEQLCDLSKLRFLQLKNGAITPQCGLQIVQKTFLTEAQRKARKPWFSPGRTRRGPAQSCWGNTAPGHPAGRRVNVDTSMGLPAFAEGEAQLSDSLLGALGGG